MYLFLVPSSGTNKNKMSSRRMEIWMASFTALLLSLCTEPGIDSCSINTGDKIKSKWENGPVATKYEDIIYIYKIIIIYIIIFIFIIYVFIFIIYYFIYIFLGGRLQFRLTGKRSPKM